MMKKFKIADLAKVWEVSTTSVWKRLNVEVNKPGYNPNNAEVKIIKEFENNREITFVEISEKFLNKFSVVNGLKEVNNQVYEELLTDENPPQPQNPSAIREFTEGLLTVSNSYQQQLLTVYEELSTYKSKIPLLEDKAGREGLYLNEINQLKTSINLKEAEYKKERKGWTIALIILFLCLCGTLTFLVYKLNNPTIIEKERVIEKIVTPQPATTTSKAVKRR